MDQYKREEQAHLENVFGEWELRKEQLWFPRQVENSAMRSSAATGKTKMGSFEKRLLVIREQMGIRTNGDFW